MLAVSGMNSLTRERVAQVGPDQSVNRETALSLSIGGFSPRCNPSITLGLMMVEAESVYLSWQSILSDSRIREHFGCAFHSLVGYTLVPKRQWRE